MTADRARISAVDGIVVVTRRELRALLQDKQALYMSVVFGLVFPLLVSRSVGRSPAILLAMATQTIVLPYIAAFQGSIVSFVSERENGTIGPLLATPLPNVAIFAGKLLAAYVPSVAISLVSLLLFLGSLPERASAARAMVPDRLFAEVLLLGAVVGLLMVLAGTIIGARAKTLRGAQMIAGIAVAPFFIGVFLLSDRLFDNEALGLVVLALIAIGTIPATWYAARVWRREEVLTAHS